MNEILSTMRFIAQPITPVHIGTGETLAQNSFILSNGLLSVINENRLFAWAEQDTSGKRALQLADSLVSNRPLKEFLDNNRIDLSSILAYQIPAHLTGNPPVKDIRTFIKQPDYDVYIPGSSLKGSLRSRLLRGLTITQNKSQRKEIEDIIDEGANRDFRKSSGSEEIEARAFIKADVRRGKYPNYDLNRTLMIRDSRSISPDKLRLYEVKIFSSRYASLEDKRTPNFVEALPPQINEKRITLSFAATWLAHLFEADDLRFTAISDYMYFLPEYCKIASLELINQEIEFYKSYPVHGQRLSGWYEEQRDRLTSMPETTFYLPIGWGSGYDAKTITDLLGEPTFKLVADSFRNTAGLGRPGNSKSSAWLGSALSPKSRKLAVLENGVLLPMGWMAVKFDFGSDEDDWYAGQRQNNKAKKPIIEIKQSTPVKQEESRPYQPEKSVQTKIEEKQKPPVKETIQITESFDAVPEIGRVFRAEVFDISTTEILAEIPGLDPDTDAYAELPKQAFARIGHKILCRVIEVTKDKYGVWLVKCELVA